MSSCPNCGAPVTGWACQYCGTVFQDGREKLDELERELQMAELELLNSMMMAELYKCWK